MNKIVRWQTFFVAVGACMIGLIAGGLLAGRYVGRRFVHQLSDEPFTRLTYNLMLLGHLRTGDTNAAINQTEMLVTGDMLSLGLLVDSTTDPKRRRAYTNVLVRATTYRARHGLRSSDPGVAGTLEELAARFPARGAAATNRNEAGPALPGASTNRPAAGQDGRQIE
jgi:hypothetical protein